MFSTYVTRALRIKKINLLVEKQVKSYPQHVTHKQEIQLIGYHIKGFTFLVTKFVKLRKIKIFPSHRQTFKRLLRSRRGECME